MGLFQYCDEGGGERPFLLLLRLKCFGSVRGTRGGTEKQAGERGAAWFVAAAAE